MSDEIIKLLAGLGVGGVIGGLAIWQLVLFRREHREDMASLRAALENLPDWLAAIHSRLTTVGADSIAPPARPGRREAPIRRLQTAPTGYPVTGDPEPPDEHEPPPLPRRRRS